MISLLYLPWTDCVFKYRQFKFNENVIIILNWLLLLLLLLLGSVRKGFGGLFSAHWIYHNLKLFVGNTQIHTQPNRVLRFLLFAAYLQRVKLINLFNAMFFVRIFFCCCCFHFDRSFFFISFLFFVSSYKIKIFNLVFLFFL